MTSVVDSSFSFKDVAADSAATSFDDDDADVDSEGATLTCSTVIDGNVEDDVVVFSISTSAVDSEEGEDDADDDEVDGFTEAAAAAASEQLSSVAGLSTGNDSGLIAKD